MYFNNNSWNQWGYQAAPGAYPSWNNSYNPHPYAPPAAPMAAPVNQPSLQVPTQNVRSEGDNKPLIYPGYKIRQGDAGEVVKVIQRRLGLSADGIYSPQVESMVKRFQMDNRIESNGMVGPNTWEKMFGSIGSFHTYSVKNDTEKDAIILWSAKKCRGKLFGIPNVCHYELVLPGDVQTYEFDEKTSSRRVGILRKGSFRMLPISSNIPEKHEFQVSAIKSSGIKLSRKETRKRELTERPSRKEMMQRVQSMMNGVVSGVKDRLPFLY